MMKNRNYFKKVIGLWMSLSFSMKHFSFGVINTEWYTEWYPKWYMTKTPVESPDLWFNDAAFMLSYEGKRESPQSDHLQLFPVLYYLEEERNEISTINAPCFTGKMVYVPIGQEKEKKVLICFLSFVGIKKALEEYSLEGSFESSNDLEKHNHNMMSLVGNFLDECNWALVNYSYSPFLAREISNEKPVIFRIVIYDKDPKHRLNSINVVRNEEYKKLSGNEVEKVIYKGLDQAFRPNDSGINRSLFNSEMREMYRISGYVHLRSFDKPLLTHINVTPVMERLLLPIFKTCLDTGYSKFYNVLPVKHIYEELIKVAGHTFDVIEMIEEGSYTVSPDIIHDTKDVVWRYTVYLEGFKCAEDIAGKLAKYPKMHLTLSNNGINTTTKEELEELNINLEEQDQTIIGKLVKSFPKISQVFHSLLERLYELKKIKQKYQFNQVERLYELPNKIKYGVNQKYQFDQVINDQVIDMQSLITNFRSILIKYQNDERDVDRIDRMLEEIQETLTNAQSQVLEFRTNEISEYNRY